RPLECLITHGLARSGRTRSTRTAARPAAHGGGHGFATAAARAPRTCRGQRVAAPYRHVSNRSDFGPRWLRAAPDGPPPVRPRCRRGRRHARSRTPEPPTLDFLGDAAAAGLA